MMDEAAEYNTITDAAIQKILRENFANATVLTIWYRYIDWIHELSEIDLEY